MLPQIPKVRDHLLKSDQLNQQEKAVQLYAHTTKHTEAMRACFCVNLYGEATHIPEVASS